MHSAAYFVPALRHAPKGQAQSRHEKLRVDASMEFRAIEGKEAFRQKAVKILLVAGLHLGLFAWLVQVDSAQRDIQSPVRLDVRTITMPSAGPVMQAGVSEAAKTHQQIARPAAPRIRQPVPQKQVTPVVQPKPLKPLQESLSTASSEAAFSIPAQATQENTNSKPQESAASVAFAAGSAAGSGSATSGARFDADYFRNPAPDYPAASRRMREEGTVYLDVHVTAEGKAGDLSIRKSSGHARLDEAALNTVRHWRFVPARRGAEAIAAQVVVPVVFRLGS
jgi:periplasmic protein TonB